MCKFAFVGERPSQKAADIGATWQNGKLAGKTLRDTLLALNINPDVQEYLNLWTSVKPCERDVTDEASAIVKVKALAAKGYVIVGMGALVNSALRRHGVEHLLMVHPAARGAIRRRDRYVAHAASVLATGSGALNV